MTTPEVLLMLGALIILGISGEVLLGWQSAKRLVNRRLDEIADWSRDEQAWSCDEQAWSCDEQATWDRRQLERLEQLRDRAGDDEIRRTIDQRIAHFRSRIAPDRTRWFLRAEMSDNVKSHD